MAWPWVSRAKLDELGEELELRRRELDYERLTLDKRSKELKAERERLKTLEGRLKREIESAIRAQAKPVMDRDEFLDTHCEHCGYFGAMTRYRVFNADTRRSRHRWVCNDSCAKAMDRDQHDLVDGEAYVRRSLGVA